MKHYYTLILLLTFIVTNAQVINFTDVALKNFLLTSTPDNPIAMDLDGNYFSIDANNDAEIDQAEALQLSWLDANYTNFEDIGSLYYFTNLEHLSIASNYGIQNFDISVFPHLLFLDCSSIWTLTSTSLNLSSTTLKTLYCQDMSVTSLSLAGLPALEKLDFGQCLYLESIDFTGAISLKEVDCVESSLTGIDFTPAINLEKIYLLACFLTSINVNGLEHLKEIDSSLDLFATLDLSNCPSLERVSIWDNPSLETLFVKNGADEIVDLYETPHLVYICADDAQVTQIQQTVTSLGYADCVVNSACVLSSDGFTNIAPEFTFYPNPVKNILNISSETKATINTIIIYNTLGQQVMKVLPAAGDYSVDVSGLPIGGYIVKVGSETTSWTAQFLKE